MKIYTKSIEKRLTPTIGTVFERIHKYTEIILDWIGPTPYSNAPLQR